MTDVGKSKRSRWRNGILALPNGRYKARYNKGLIEKDGKMVMSKPCKTFDSMKEATQWRRGELIKLDKAVHPSDQVSEERTIAKMIADYKRSRSYMALRGKEANSNSQRTVDCLIANFQKFCDLSANQVRTVRQFDKRMAEEFESYAFANFKGHGSFRLITLAKHLFERERKLHDLLQNPFWVVDLRTRRKAFNQSRTEPRVLNLQERNAILSNASDKDFHLLTILFLGGFRPKAIRYMRRADVDLANLEMTEKEHSKGEPDHYKPKSKGKVVPLHGQLLQSVMWFMERTEGQKYAFNLERDAPLGDQYVWRACERAKSKALQICPSLKDVTPKVFRATCGSLIKMAGGTHHAQIVLGHGHERTTSTYYINNDDKAYREKAFSFIEASTKSEAWRRDRNTHLASD
jgi:integrase